MAYHAGSYGMTGGYHQTPGAYDAGADTRSSLWMGEIEPPLDEPFLTSLIPTLVTGPVRVKMIRDRSTGNLANYCFLDFRDHSTAEAALTSLNGTLIPNAGGKIFRLNWANGGGGAGGGDQEYSVFVGDLGPEVTEEMLLGFFVQYFGSVKGVKLLMDPSTGQSKGYGFVRFYDESDQQRALTEMTGQYCGSRAIRVSTATPRQKPGFSGNASAAGGGAAAGAHQGWGGGGGGGGGGVMGATGTAGAWGGGGGVQGQMGQGAMATMAAAPTAATVADPMSGGNGTYDTKSTTLFVGNVHGITGEEQLRPHFTPYGEVVSVKALPDRAIAFVEYANRAQAEQAMAALNGAQIGTQAIRLSWGRGGSSGGGPAGGHLTGGGAPAFASPAGAGMGYRGFGRGGPPFHPGGGGRSFSNGGGFGGMAGVPLMPPRDPRECEPVSSANARFITDQEKDMIFFDSVLGISS
ncbi:MAG: hypothetical protein DHS80DRAFT_26996 [Piptocephalis tieghemiana]|nr:MAG: hypothetical protein DHS80DRAFT_26996 [Piptocephalis tieghemiana]